MSGAPASDSDRRPPLRINLAVPGLQSASEIEPWFEKTWRGIYGRTSEVNVPPGVTAETWVMTSDTDIERRLVEVSGRPIGLLSYTLTGSHRVTIHELATAPDHRDLGFGAEAVYALEAESGAAEGMALVPFTNGLAIYFWMRIGYRPSFYAQHQQNGLTVMVRDLIGRDARPEA